MANQDVCILQPTGVSVVRAGPADVDRLAPLVDEYRQFHGAASDVTATREFLAERMRKDESVVFLALVGDRAAGFAQIYPSFSTGALAPVMILNDLFVVPEFRRMRVGTALLSEVDAFAWSQKASRLQLNVLRANTGAQGLYAASGWKSDDQYFMFLRYPPGSARPTGASAPPGSLPADSPARLVR